jgi:putative oxidoreductase
MGEKAFAPAPFQALAAIAEFGGGLAWIVGLLVPLASFGMACTMIVAIYSLVAMYHAPFVSQTGGMSAELPSAFLGIALVLMTVGPGRISLDYLLFGRRGLRRDGVDS